MKKFISMIVMAIAAITLLIRCEQFSTSYQRVDATEFRMLKYIWEPADAAPGDTITLTAVFAGKPKDNLRNDLDWCISFNVIRDLFGNTTVVDSTPFEAEWEWRLVDFSPNTQAIEFKIPVPSDIVIKSKSIPEDWASALPTQLRKMIPPEFSTLKKDEIVEMIELSANNAADIDKERAKMLVPVLQYFTVPMRVFTKEPNRKPYPHTIISTQYIRYNNRFKINKTQQIDGIPENRIPVVDSVVVYKVKGSDVGNIEDKSGISFEEIVLREDGSSVIAVEDGYSYFLDAITHPIDTTVTMYGNPEPEKHRKYRQFQLDKNETAGVHHSKFMEIDNFTGKITMPTDKNIQKFIFWLTVYDEAQNERLRPYGETLVERSGRLCYNCVTSKTPYMP